MTARRSKSTSVHLSDDYFDGEFTPYYKERQKPLAKGVIQETEDNSKALADELNQKFSKMEVTLDKVESNLERKVSKLDDQLRNDKLQSIQILALFVAFFTFVSVQFQLYATVKDALSMTGLSLVLLGALLLFLAFVHLGINYFREKPRYHGEWLKSVLTIALAALTILAVLLIAGGILLNSLSRSSELARRTQQQKACQNLTQQITVAIDKNTKTVDFLKSRYTNECKSIWAE